ncbi:hypothetical protein BCON_0029g00290 [Botryotinia convoluta]|uniref:Uncharacterized protein n=1 Tax=Botryotinia convoluta TaxID=54673 RepID=A0A4Z1IIF7_9HELO|nr:hypothetical protein BCON_0029g00290 [Botryotinia convoluta]
MCVWEFVYLTMKEVGLTESMLRAPNYRGVRIYYTRRCNRYYALFPDGSQLYSSTGGIGATEFKIPPSDELTPERQKRILEQLAERVRRENASVQRLARYVRRDERQNAEWVAKHFAYRTNPVD